MRTLLSLLLIALIAIANTVNGRGSLPWLLLLALFAAALVASARRERKREDFRQQLKSHRRELRAGGTVVVDELLVRYDTVLTTFTLQIGILFDAITIRSPYRLADRSHQSEAWISSLVTIVAGWWSIPMGPLAAIGVVTTNLRGGEPTTVARLIDHTLLERHALAAASQVTPTAPAAPEL